MAQQRRPPTKSGLLADARHAVLPTGIATTGFPAVERTCAQLGLVFDPWQSDLNRCILAKDSSGMYAADTVAMSVPRQVGKTWNVGALVFADSVIHPGTTTVWTAHRFKVARETFDELRALAMTPKLAPHIDADEITTGAGNESIAFRNGSRIVFAARERGAIRGFTKVRRLILDEAQILTERALADLVPTMNQAENPQIILMGTPPRPVDPGEVFRRVRTEALDGESEGVLYVEFSAEPGASPDDWDAVREANPSYPRRTPKKAILRMRKLLSPEDYLREGLGIWDDPTGTSIFGAGSWDSCHGDHDSSLKVSALGLAVTLDLNFASIAAGAMSGELVYGRPLRHAPRTNWVVEACKELQDRHGADVVVDGRGPAAVLVPHLEAAGIRVRLVTTAEMFDACADFDDRVRSERFRHAGYPELDAAVAGAVKRAVGDRWVWGRKASTSDVSPLEAVTLAAWGAAEFNQPRESVYEERGLVTL